MDNYLDSLPDELLLDVCNNMSDATLVNSAETSWRVYTVCKEVLEERKRGYLKPKLTAEKILNSNGANITSGNIELNFRKFTGGYLIQITEQLPYDEKGILQKIFPGDNSPSRIFSGLISTPTGQEDLARVNRIIITKDELIRFLKELQGVKFNLDNLQILQ